MIKDPASKLDFQIDWSPVLNGDPIALSTWQTGGGLVVDSDYHSAQLTTVWLSGGTVGVCSATNTVTTAGGRIDSRTIQITVAKR